jgi:hypothetical protein
MQVTITTKSTAIEKTGEIDMRIKKKVVETNEVQVETDPAILEFLAKGGVIQSIPTGKSSPEAGNSAWGNSKAKPKPKDITDINIDALD